MLRAVSGSGPLAAAHLALLPAPSLPHLPNVIQKVAATTSSSFAARWCAPTMTSVYPLSGGHFDGIGNVSGYRYLRTKSARARVRWEDNIKKEMTPFGIEQAITRVPLTLAPPTPTEKLVRLRAEARKKIAFALTPNRVRQRQPFQYVRTFWRRHRHQMTLREWNALLEYYGARRALPQIDEALVDMTTDGIQPDAQSFAFAIEANCRNGRLHSCRSFMERMREQQVLPDVRSYEHLFTLLLRRFNKELLATTTKPTATKSMDSGSSNVLGAAVPSTSTLPPTSALAQAAIATDTKPEDTLNNNDDEKDASDTLTSSTNSLYENVRYAVVVEQEMKPYEEMVMLYHQMINDKIQPSITIYTAVLQAAIARKDTTIINEIATGMRNHGIDSKTTIIGLVHDTLHLETERHVPLPPLTADFVAREQLVSEAEAAYNATPIPPILVTVDIIPPSTRQMDEQLIYSSLISAYARGGNGAAIMTTLRDMRLQAIRPNNDCYAAAMAHFARLGDFERVLRLYDDMMTLNVVTSSIIEALRLRAMGGVGQVDKMIATLKNAARPSLLSYKAVMGVLATNGDIKQLEQILKLACSSSLRTLEPLQLDRDIFQIVFHAYATKGMYKECAILMKTMKSQFGLTPDANCYNSLVEAFDVGGRIVGCLGVMSLMAKAQIQPNHGTYTRVMQACAAHGQLHRTWRIWRDMWMVHRWPRNLQSYGALITSLIRAGEPERAVHQFMQMRKEKIQPTIGLLQTLLTPLITWPRVATQVQTYLTRLDAITGGSAQLMNEQLPQGELAQLELFIRYSLGPDIQLARLAARHQLQQQSMHEAIDGEHDDDTDAIDQHEDVKQITH